MAKMQDKEVPPEQIENLHPVTGCLLVSVVIVFWAGFGWLIMWALRSA